MLRNIKFWAYKLAFLTGAYTYMRPCRQYAFCVTFARSISF